MAWRPEHKDPAYGTAAWKRARLACLRAANWKCQIRGPGCLGAASTADHIDGLAADPQHKRLQAACQVCHDAKTHRESGEARRGRQSDPQPTPRTQWLQAASERLQMSSKAGLSRASQARVSVPCASDRVTPGPPRSKLRPRCAWICPADGVTLRVRCDA